jgi:HAE1 family hydrophobic/amphiphilic exporter-1
VDITSDLQLANPQVSVTLDRDRIAALGLTIDQVSAMMGAYTSQVGMIYAPTNGIRSGARLPSSGPA